MRYAASEIPLMHATNYLFRFTQYNTSQIVYCQSLQLQSVFRLSL